jgi:Met-10+ like-protein
MTRRVGAIGYYLSSLPALLRGVRSPLRTIVSLARSSRRGGAVVEMAGVGVAGVEVAGVEVVLTDGTRFVVRTLMDLWIIKETCLDREYERIGPSIVDGWTVLDIGAGLGDFCVHVARRFPRSKVIGFEPFLPSFNLLQRNITMNTPPPSSKPIQRLRGRPAGASLWPTPCTGKGYRSATCSKSTAKAASSTYCSMRPMTCCERFETSAWSITTHSLRTGTVNWWTG